MKRTVNANLILSELQFTASRSSGPGGQHANKVETRVQVRFDVAQSVILTDAEKETLQKAHANKLTKEAVLIIDCEEKRSQLKNKQIAIKKLNRLFEKAFTVTKRRKPTKPSKAAKMERLKSKKKHAEKKNLRGKIQRSDE